MADLVVVVPSRGRPGVIADMAASFDETCRADTLMLVVVDAGSADLDDYRAAVNLAGPRVALQVVPGGTMVKALNEAAVPLANSDPAPTAIGFMGDDHRPRTPGWDKAYLDALAGMGGVGIVYGNDLIQFEFVPTQCAMTSNIVRALGWMSPPTLRHMYVDTIWRDIGRKADCLKYLPDVIVEHMHPIRGKNEWDEGYNRVNAPEVYAADEKAFLAIHGPGTRRGEIDDIADTIRGLRTGSRG